MLDITALTVPADPSGPLAPIVVNASFLLYDPVNVIVGDKAIEPEATKLSLFHGF